MKVELTDAEAKLLRSILGARLNRITGRTIQTSHPKEIKYLKDDAILVDKLLTKLEQTELFR